MSTIQKRLLLHMLMIGALLLPACAPSPGAGPQNPDAVVQTIVAATIAAIPSRTPLPTAQPTPTRLRLRATDFPTLTPVSSITPIPPTFTITPSLTLTASPTDMTLGGAEVGKVQGNNNYSCQVLAQKPDDWTNFKPGYEFLVVWTIKNAGAKDWPVGSLDIIHVEGEKMFLNASHKESEIAVTSGDYADFSVWMKAPSKAGAYITRWALRRKDTIFCHFAFQIIVR